MIPPLILQNTFAKALQPLTKLIHLYLGVFLSDEKFFYSHLDHACAVKPYAPDECFLCRQSGPVDTVRERELEASEIMAKRLKCLESISWSTFFVQGNGGGERSTTKWVLRKDGKIRMKGTPWS